MVVLIFCKRISQRIISIFLSIIIFLSFTSVFSLSAAASNWTFAQTLAIQKIKQGFYSFDEKIDLTEFGVTPDEIADLFVFVIKNDPYLFFVDTKLSYYYKNDGSMFYIKPKYTVTPEEATQMITFCLDEVRRIAGLVHPKMSDAEKALFVHDYLCEQYTYDRLYASDDMYKFLVNKTGTCQGYAWTYMAILREISIECCYVASDTINHIWNMVKIDGEWYHCDVTWDDGEQPTRRHFLCSDEKALAQGHKDWYSAYGVQCASVTYDALDFASITHRVYSGDCDHDGKLTLYDLVLLRRHISTKGSDICQICADTSADLVCDLADAEILRQKLLMQRQS